MSLVLIIAIIIAVVAIWNARYEILNGIIDFALSLIPPALLIGAVVYLFHRIIR